MNAPSLTATITANLTAVRQEIERAAVASHRDPAGIRLIAVSKTFPIDHIRAAADAGQRDFGENRVQEALSKIEAAPGADCAWHLIGHLQSNKARKAVGPFATIQSVDSLDLLRRLDTVASEERRRIDVMLQVDLADEATKFGIPEAETREALAAARGMTHARAIGLMLLPPWSEDPEATRPYFQRLRRLRDDLRDEGFPPELLRELSMGMSHDYGVAIEEGATMVRVGTAIFGKRTMT